MVSADPEPSIGSSRSKRVAWIAFGVYLLSFLPFGFLFFYIGFLSLLNPLLHTFMHSDHKTVLAGISWLANPIVLVGMVARGVSARWTAAVLGIIALGCALCAFPCLLHPLQLPAYVLWLGSMALVVFGGTRPGERADPMNHGFAHAKDDPDRLERVDGKTLSKPQVERIMELYDELP